MIEAVLPVFVQATAAVEATDFIAHSLTIHWKCASSETKIRRQLASLIYDRLLTGDPGDGIGGIPAAFFFGCRSHGFLLAAVGSTGDKRRQYLGIGPCPGRMNSGSWEPVNRSLPGQSPVGPDGGVGPTLHVLEVHQAQHFGVSIRFRGDGFPLESR